MMNNDRVLRMLLSHNFELADERVPVLSREAFTQLFSDGFASQPEVACRQVDNPHWVVEIMCPAELLSPQQVGEHCARILAESRSAALGSIDFDILVLGGIKTTPATSSSPDALQPNQWGVDVVETRSGDRFLKSIGWESTIASKPPASIFKVERLGN
jgi:Protein of unknown function (DUF2656)